MRIPLLFLLVATLLIEHPVAAYVVDSVDDASDASPGDALCATTDGVCTLRAAVEEANASPGLDLIELGPRTYHRTIGSELSITDDVDVRCTTGVATIDALGSGRVLHVAAGATASLSRLVVRGGMTSGAPGGAGILNEGTLRLDRVTVVVNTGDAGAGILNTGMVQGADVLVDHNGPGSAIQNQGSLTIEGGTIAANEDVGLENWGTVGLFRVVIHHNRGGIADYQPLSAGGGVVVERSVLAYNGKLGAIDTTGGVLLRNSTVSGNEGARASAVLVRGGGTLQLEYVTLGDNGSPDTPAAALDGDGSGTIRARNTVVAGNHASGGDPDCRVTVESLGSNVMSCPLAAPDPTTAAGDPRLGPLKEWRVVTPGSTDEVTLAHGLLPGSAAIDAGSCDPSATDQRGVARPQGAGCDIGAFEVAPLCTAGVGIANARVAIRQSARGTSTIKVDGALGFASPGSPAVDPLADGLQLRIDRLDDGGAPLLERTELTSPLIGVRQGCEGWRVIRPRTRFGWRSSATGAPLCLPGHVGRLAVGLDDQRGKAGGIALKSKATIPHVDPGAAVRVTVALGADALGSDPATPAPACAARDLLCTRDAQSTRYDCR